MWRTPHGDRVLRGAEWELFREGLATLWDWVEDSSGNPEMFASGIEVFDRLQFSQKLEMMATVGTALHDESTPQPEHTANNEAIVAAVFRRIAGEIAMDIEAAHDPEWMAGLDSPDEITRWRKRTLAANRDAELRAEAEGLARLVSNGKQKSDALCGDRGLSVEPRSLLDASSEDIEEWRGLVEYLTDQILWDRDFENGDIFLDGDPDLVRLQLKMSRIDRSYFTDIVTDPTEEQLEPLRRTLQALCGRPAGGQFA